MIRLSLLSMSANNYVKQRDIAVQVRTAKEWIFEVSPSVNLALSSLSRKLQKQQKPKSRQYYLFTTTHKLVCSIYNGQFWCKHSTAIYKGRQHVYSSTCSTVSYYYMLLLISLSRCIQNIWQSSWLPKQKSDGSKAQQKKNAASSHNKLCGKPPQYAPANLLPLWAPKRLAPPSRPRLHTAK